MVFLAQAGRWDFHHGERDFQRNANGLSFPARAVDDRGQAFAAEVPSRSQAYATWTS
jgi:hypothetical protein